MRQAGFIMMHATRHEQGLKDRQPWSSMMKYQPWSSLMHHTRSWLIRQAWYIMMLQAWTRVDEPSTLIKLDATSFVKMDRSPTLVKPWYQCWCWVPNHQPWSSIQYWKWKSLRNGRSNHSFCNYADIRWSESGYPCFWYYHLLPLCWNKTPVISVWMRHVEYPDWCGLF